MSNCQKQPPEMFYKKAAHKDSAIFTEKHLATLLKRDPKTCFPVNIAKFLRAPISGDGCFRSDFIGLLVTFSDRTSFLDSRFQNHLDLVILQKYQLLSIQNYKQFGAYALFKFLLNQGFECSSLMVTTEKANAFSTWTFVFLL